MKRTKAALRAVLITLSVTELVSWSCQHTHIHTHTHAYNRCVRRRIGCRRGCTAAGDADLDDEEGEHRGDDAQYSRRSEERRVRQDRAERIHLQRLVCLGEGGADEQEASADGREVVLALEDGELMILEQVLREHKPRRLGEDAERAVRHAAQAEVALAKRRERATDSDDEDAHGRTRSRDLDAEEVEEDEGDGRREGGEHLRAMRRRRSAPCVSVCVCE